MSDEASPAIRQLADGISFAVRVQPRSSKNEVTGVQGDALRVRLTSPPVDGEANRHCIEFFAELLGVAKRDVIIIAGDTSRNKMVKVSGIGPERLLAALTPSPGKGKR